MDSSTRPAAGLPSPKLTLVLHCYNESRHLSELLDQWLHVLRTEIGSFEILALNAGSNDGTGRILDDFRKENKEIRVHHQLRIGPVRSFRKGFEMARGAYIGQARATGQYCPEDFVRMWRAREGFELVLGTRTHRLDSFPRRTLSHGLRKTLSLGFGLDLGDSNIPFRLFRRETVLPLLSKLPEGTESLHIALAVLLKNAYPEGVLEVKVPYRHPLKAKPDESVPQLYRQSGKIMLELLHLRLSLKGLVSDAPSHSS